MEHPFMRSIYAETFDVEAYCQYLAGLWHIFSTIEEQSLKAGDPVSQLDDVKLHRREALQQDLAFWWGSDWQQKASNVSTATAAYLQQLQKDSADPYSLLCHHFLQYNAVLSGGQFLGSKVAKRSKKAPPSGVHFYTFALEEPSPHACVQRYLDDLDKLNLSNELRDRMLQTMKTIYRLILGTFDEAHQLCPVDGVSYASIKAGAAPVDPSPPLAATPAASPKVPPPPVAPGDRKFTLQELVQYDGSDASKPLFMSLLGRVYDVSSGKESFGPGGPYAAFAGHDATYNLAVMTLKKQTVDTFEYVLEPDDKECLADWISYFDNHYGKPLGTLDKQHCIALKDLPRATKIPFSQETEAPASKL